MRIVAGIVLIAFSLVVFGYRIAKKIEFKRHVTEYLKHAADANTIELAHQELTKAINYLEANELTSGYTSIFYETPKDDISFWYQNLKASQQELAELDSESALERTNVLIKLRETLVDSGESTKVTKPKGIDVYPHNFTWMLLIVSALISICVGLALLIPQTGEQNQTKEA